MKRSGDGSKLMNESTIVGANAKEVLSSETDVGCGQSLIAAILSGLVEIPFADTT